MSQIQEFSFLNEQRPQQQLQQGQLPDYAASDWAEQHKVISFPASAVTSPPRLTPVYQVAYLDIQTERGPQFIDITQRVLDFVAECGLDFGTVLVYSQHTTAAIKINENEPLLIEDMCDRLSQIFPPGDGTAYRHNDFEIRTHNMTPDEHPNGHSHCQHLLLSTSETLPVVEGRLQLGRWQRLFLVELDCARPRRVVLLANGHRLGL